MTVAVLFSRSDSIYRTMPGLDVWDEQRDAKRWQGGCPVVAHPPCRMWGRYAQWAKGSEAERALSVWAVDQVRKWGGVLRCREPLAPVLVSAPAHQPTDPMRR